MTETLLALFLAHVVADFLAQPAGIALNKHRPGPLLVHGAIVLVTAHAAIGIVFSLPLVALAGLHVVIDAAKAQLLPRRLWPFLLDQAAHAATLVAVAVLVPSLWAEGAWAGLLPAEHLDVALHGALLFIGLTYALRAGEFAIGLLMQPFAGALRAKGLPNGGRLIGWLERGLIFLVIGLGQPLGIGFLIAAKSILRFGTAARDQRASEYVIIGTLASFGWALGFAALTFWIAQTFLPPLEIIPARP